MALLTALGRRLVGNCMNCQDFGIASIENGRMTTKCDRGDFSSCARVSRGSEAHFSYV